MKIVSILNPKGGSGKSTLSTNLAATLASMGKRVLLADSDRQGTSRDWHDMLDPAPFPIVGADTANAVLSLTHNNVDVIIIDGTAKIEKVLGPAIKIADLVLIPCRPSGADVWAAQDLIEMISDRQEIADGQPIARFIYTQVVSNTNLLDDLAAAIEQLGVPALQQQIGFRQAYAKAMTNGFSVVDGDDPKAKAEIIAVANEILELIA